VRGGLFVGSDFAGGEEVAAQYKDNLLVEGQYEYETGDSTYLDCAGHRFYVPK
jgi:hypothetical protein